MVRECSDMLANEEPAVLIIQILHAQNQSTGYSLKLAKIADTQDSIIILYDLQIMTDNPSTAQIWVNKFRNLQRHVPIYTAGAISTHPLPIPNL